MSVKRCVTYAWCPTAFFAPLPRRAVATHQQLLLKFLHEREFRLTSVRNLLHISGIALAFPFGFLLIGTQRPRNFQVPDRTFFRFWKHAQLTAFDGQECK